MDIQQVKASILKNEVCYCPICSGLVKPDIVFFGENLPARYFALQDTDPEADDHWKLEFYPFAQLADLVPNYRS